MLLVDAIYIHCVFIYKKGNNMGLIILGFIMIFLSIRSLTYVYSEDSYRSYIKSNIERLDFCDYKLKVTLDHSLFYISLAINLLLYLIYIYAAKVTGAFILAGIMIGMSLFDTYMNKKSSVYDVNSFYYNKVFYIGFCILRIIFWIFIIYTLTIIKGWCIFLLD